MNQDPALHPTVARVTARIIGRSRSPHADYLRRRDRARTNGPLVDEAQWRSGVAHARRSRPAKVAWAASGSR